MLWVVVNLQQIAAVPVSVETVTNLQKNAHSVRMLILSMLAGLASTNRIVRIARRVIAIISMVLVHCAFRDMLCVLVFVKFNRIALITASFRNAILGLAFATLAILGIGQIQLDYVLKHKTAQPNVVHVSIALVSAQNAQLDTFSMQLGIVFQKYSAIPNALPRLEVATTSLVPV